MYEIYLDDLHFYGVEWFEEKSGREIRVYGGIGLGNYPWAGDREPKRWSFQCELAQYAGDCPPGQWSRAEMVFARLGAMLNGQDPVRMVVYSRGVKLSQQVLVEDWSRKERFASVYEVEVSCMEYVPAAVRWTGEAEIPRPGNPATPEQVVLGGGISAFDIQHKYGEVQYPKSNPLIGAGSGDAWGESPLLWDGSMKTAGILVGGNGGAVMAGSFYQNVAGLLAGTIGGTSL